jgi:hypothetical protein
MAMNSMMVHTMAESTARMLWGPSPLPSGARMMGTVVREGGESGALIRMPTRTFMQGNAGAIRSLDQRAVMEALVDEARGHKERGEG